MDFNAEKAELIEKIQQDNTVIEQLTNSNQSMRLLNVDQMQKLEEIKQKNLNFQHKLESNEFEIAIVGLEKAGKSTFANALIKSSILPSAPERCTFTSTRLVSGTNNASVQFYTESEFEAIFQELLKELEYSNQNHQAETPTLTDDVKAEIAELNARKERLSKNFNMTLEERNTRLSKIEEQLNYLTTRQSEKPPSTPIKQPKNPSFKNLSLDQFNKFFENLATQNPTLYKNHVGKTDEEIKDILKCRDKLNLTGEVLHFSGEQLKTNAFQSYIKGENQGQDTSKPRSVKNIRIESSELKQLENAIIYDVPGFDSPTKIHIRQTEERLKQADAIILVTNVASNPSLQGTTLSVITKNTDEDGIALKDKLFVFGNQLDRVNNLEQIQGNPQILVKDVEKYKIGERKRVFVGSARKYLIDEKIIPSEKSNHDIDAGIDQIRTALISYYETERFEILKRKIDTNKKIMQSIFTDIVNNIDIDEHFSQETEKAKITKSAYKAIEERLKWELQKLRDDLKNEILIEKYFSTKFRQSVSDNTMYFKELSEDEFERTRILEDDSVRLDLAIQRINQKSREQLHKQHLEDFTHLIKKMTDDKAKDIEIRLLRTFTTALVFENSSELHAVEPLCKKYIHKITHDVAHSDNSFTYLIERFSRDIFDVLLLAPVCSFDRKNRYQEAINEYIYLDSYYSRRQGILINIILNQTKRNLPNGVDSIVIEEALKAAQQSSNKNQVIKEINTDVANLKDVLVTAVVPASNLELAFLNGLDKQIKRLIGAFEVKNHEFSENWDDFIAKIVPIVKQSEFAQIQERIEAHELQKTMLSQVKEIIGS